jgi:hypothetical protein
MDGMSDETLPAADDVLGIWAHPEGTQHVPCVCCGTCTCDFHGGETHNDKRWCFICVGRGHHEDDT